jgi:NAD(P)H-hydrate epimerase
MDPLPQALYRARDLRELDRIAIAEHGLSGYSLMKRAGEAAFHLLRRTWPRARRIAVLCGGGNNGGDGLVAARLLREAGMPCRVFLLAEAARLQGEARQAYEDLIRSGLQPETFSAALRPDAEVMVDALLGTGLDREVNGLFREAIDWLNGQRAPVLSLDIPSGLHADTGQPLGAAVRAAVTLSFIALKQGLFTAEGPDYCGRIVCDDLALPAEVYAKVASPAFRLVDERIASLLPLRPRSAHKGCHGHVLVVGGAPGMAGALRLAGEAAARAGAGLVTLATHPVHAAALNAARPELICHGVADPKALAPLLERATVVAVGPGLGAESWGRPLLRAVLDSGLPQVVDADALNWLAHEPRRCGHWILTPHPGEAARLLNITAAEVQRDRWQAVRELQRRYGGVVVLKGAGSLICRGQDPVALCDAGNPGMATGAMGDLLTGVIAGLRAQGLDDWQAATAGVYLHGRAGDLAAEDGERGLMASDLLAPLRRLVNPIARS